LDGTFFLLWQKTMWNHHVYIIKHQSSFTTLVLHLRELITCTNTREFFDKIWRVKLTLIRNVFRCHYMVEGKIKVDKDAKQNNTFKK